MSNVNNNSVTINKALEMDGDKVVYCESFVVSREFLETALDNFVEFESVEAFLENYDPDDEGQALYDLAEAAGEIEDEFTSSKDSVDDFEFSDSDLDDILGGDVADDDEGNEFEFEDDDEDVNSFINGEPLEDGEELDAFKDLPILDM